MALKHKLTQTEFDALATDVLKNEYKKSGDGYILDVTGIDDVTELRRAKDREVEAARVAREERDEARRKVSELEASSSRETRDIATIERSWQEKVTNIETKHKTETDALRSALQKRFRDDVAKGIAAELAGENYDVILPHIQNRLAAEMDGENPVTRVLDKDGKPSALTLDELKKEFVDNKKFAPIIVISNATGGGAGSSGASRTGANGGAGKSKKFADLNDAERVALFKENPAEFNRLSEENKREVNAARGI